MAKTPTKLPKQQPTNPVAKNASAAIGGGAAGRMVNKSKRDSDNATRGQKHKNKSFDMAETLVAELSTTKLAKYKTAASKDASAADKKGDTAKANKRFSGIVKATNKQFANDAKNEDMNQFKDILDKQHVPVAAPKASTKDVDFNGWTIRYRPASNNVQWAVLDRRGDIKNKGSEVSAEAALAAAKAWITSGGGQTQQSTSNVTIDFNVAFARQFAPEGETFFATVDQDNGQPVLIFSTERQKGFKSSAIRTQKEKITSGTVRLPCITLSPKEANAAKLVPNGRYVLGDQDQIDDNTYMYPLIYQSTVQAKGDVMQMKQPGLTIATSRNVEEDRISELRDYDKIAKNIGYKASMDPNPTKSSATKAYIVKRHAEEKAAEKKARDTAKAKGDARVQETFEPLRKQKLKESYTDFLHNVLEELINKKK